MGESQRRTARTSARVELSSGGEAEIVTTESYVVARVNGEIAVTHPNWMTPEQTTRMANDLLALAATGPTNRS